MHFSTNKLVRWFFIFLSLLLLVCGFAFLWHYIAPNTWFGIAPEGDMPTDDDWYVYNERTGWALAFCGFTLLVFAWFMRKEKSTWKYIVGSLLTLFSTAALAALAIELIMKFTNAT